jgi:hypothetical protein
MKFIGFINNTMKTNYRKIWKNHYGEIPKDSDGRSYEIHHKDGNRNNNDINNLICVSIKEHYNIHYQQEDYGACVMIAKRIQMPSDYLSEIQRGKKRPGIGGVKKGTVPWNKGISGYKLSFSEDGIKNKIASAKKNNIIKDYDAEKIRVNFTNQVDVEDNRIGKVQQNGRLFSYERAFCLKYAKEYDVSDQYIYRIIKNKAKNVQSK